MLASIHWLRVLVAGAASEAGVILVLLASIAIYKKLIAPGAETKALGERIGYYVAPPAGFFTTGLAALWAVRGLEAGVVANAVAVGVVSVVITLPFMLGAKPEHRLMYGIAFALRLVGAYLVGLLSASAA